MIFCELPRHLLTRRRVILHTRPGMHQPGRPSVTGRGSHPGAGWLSGENAEFADLLDDVAAGADDRSIPASALSSALGSWGARRNEGTGSHAFVCCLPTPVLGHLGP